MQSLAITKWWLIAFHAAALIHNNTDLFLPKTPVLVIVVPFVILETRKHAVL